MCTFVLDACKWVKQKIEVRISSENKYFLLSTIAFFHGNFTHYVFCSIGNTEIGKCKTNGEHFSENNTN